MSFQFSLTANSTVPLIIEDLTFSRILYVSSSECRDAGPIGWLETHCSALADDKTTDQVQARPCSLIEVAEDVQ